QEQRWPPQRYKKFLYLRGFASICGYLPFISRTVMEYGGKARVKSTLSPSTLAVTGTSLSGSVMVLVSSGLLAASVMVWPLRSMDFTPEVAMWIAWVSAVRFTTFT